VELVVKSVTNESKAKVASQTVPLAEQWFRYDSGVDRVDTGYKPSSLTNEERYPGRPLSRLRGLYTER